MTDRGFNIRDMLTKKNVYLNIPPFSKLKEVRFPFAIDRSINKDVLLHPFYLCECTKEIHSLLENMYSVGFNSN